jgi:hypothetical protein
MVETIALDTKTVILKSDSENDLSEIINLINQKDRIKNIESFLKFASGHRIIKKDYKFNREDCYDR